METDSSSIDDEINTQRTSTVKKGVSCLNLFMKYIPTYILNLFLQKEKKQQIF